MAVQPTTGPLHTDLKRKRQQQRQALQPLSNRSRKVFYSKVCGQLPKPSAPPSRESDCVFWLGSQRADRLGTGSGLVFGRQKRSVCEIATVLVYGAIPGNARRRRRPSCHNRLCIHPHHTYSFDESYRKRKKKYKT